MKFTVFLFAALAVAAAAESEFSSGIVPKTEGGSNLIQKLSKWLSFNLPLFAPIRTTPRPKPATARPPAARPTTSRPRPTTAAPPSQRPTSAPPSQRPTSAPPSQRPTTEAEAPAPTDATNHLPHMDPIAALNQLYQMEGLKDLLPPMSEILDVDPSKPDLMQKPVGEVASPYNLNLLQSILEFMNSRPAGSINLDEPITLTGDGKLASDE